MVFTNFSDYVSTLRVGHKPPVPPFRNTLYTIDVFVMICVFSYASALISCFELVYAFTIQCCADPHLGALRGSNPTLSNLPHFKIVAT